MTVHTKRYRIGPEEKVRLDKWDPNDTSGYDGKKEDGLDELEQLSGRLEPLQEVLYAEHTHKVLILLQAMDTAGKDATIRRVFEGVNPQGVRVEHFGPPTPEELDHDFLWREHKLVPGRGEVVIFNRSYYEGVLVERVHALVPKEVWQLRFHQINEFERLLSETGTTVLKFYLHIDKDEQKKRLEDRLKDPSKQWKFSTNDLPERKFWSEYMKAYEEALERTSTDWAPWYVIPSNHGWFRDLLVSDILVNTLEGLKMQYPSLKKSSRPVDIK